MQVNFNPVNMNFKGSFKIEDLNALISDFEESDEEIAAKEELKRKQQEEIKAKTQYKAPILMRKRTSATDKDGRITHIDIYPSVLYSTNRTLPEYVRHICKKDMINPNKDLFMTSGLSEKSKRYVLFNYFYTDEKTGVDCVQTLYCESDDENLTQFQKDIIKIFNDPRNKKHLCMHSKTNPFVIAKNSRTSICNVVPSAISGLECVSKEMKEEDIIDENGKVNTVIYTHEPAGIYTRYRVIHLYK